MIDFLKTTTKILLLIVSLIYSVQFVSLAWTGDSQLSDFFYAAIPIILLAVILFEERRESRV